MDDVEKLQFWLDGKYVSPPEFKDSLKAVIENIGDMAEKHAEKDIAIKNLLQENNLLRADRDLLQAKWEAQGLMIQKLHENNRKYEKALSQVVFAGTEEMKTEIAKNAVHFFNKE